MKSSVKKKNEFGTPARAEGHGRFTLKSVAGQLNTRREKRRYLAKSEITEIQVGRK